MVKITPAEKRKTQLLADKKKAKKEKAAAAITLSKKKKAIATDIDIEQGEDASLANEVAALASQFENKLSGKSQFWQLRAKARGDDDPEKAKVPPRGNAKNLVNDEDLSSDDEDTDDLSSLSFSDDDDGDDDYDYDDFFDEEKEGLYEEKPSAKKKTKNPTVVTKKATKILDSKKGKKSVKTSSVGAGKKKSNQSSGKAAKKKKNTSGGKGGRLFGQSTDDWD